VTGADSITLLLVDDHDVVREGLKTILEREPDMRVVGEAASAEAALDLLPRLDPVVAVLDQRLPGMKGIELCREIAERRLRAQVVILSAFLEQETVESALRAGARAYVVKDVEAAELKRAIRAAAKGQTTIDPKVAGRFVEWAARRPRRRYASLSPRHLRVLRGLVEGKSAREIGRVTGLTLQTVKSYMREIYSSLGVNSRAEAVAAALRQRLT
jgi:DNA-binding NarL/FixJ family response regulator